MKKIWLSFVFIFFGATFTAFSQDSVQRKKEYLKEILDINIDQRFRANTRRVSVEDSTWMDWLKRTGELPPDFSKMRSIPNLPEPLIEYRDGNKVPITTVNQWEKKREWIKAQYQHWVSGHAPGAPGNVEANVLTDEVQENGTRVQMIELRFGPGHKAKMTVELIIPPGSEEKPVFMTQWNHRDWAQLAVKRGYIGCVYAAADLKDDTDPYMFIYPDYDFSGLMRRAFGASRVVDYLLTRREVNKDQIAITGHSRNGKQSLWAAAFDERISAVVSSSSSTGGDMPWRYGDPQFASETLDYVMAWNAHWFHPRLRFFSGREDKLPVDQNLLGALIAPRPLLYHYSIVERGLNSWSNEQNYYSVKKVYDFLGVPDHVGVLTRMGPHAVAARDVEQTIDFLDIQFGRSDQKWSNELYYPYDYKKWESGHPSHKEKAKEIVPVKLKNSYRSATAFQEDKEKIIDNLNWILGDEPAGVRAVNVGSWQPANRDWINLINPIPEVKGAKEIYLGPYSAVGDHVSAVLYCPVDSTSGEIKTGANGRLPIVIYSHQYAYSSGFVKGHDKGGRLATRDLFESLVKRGFAVMAIDMYGFGTRIWEAKNFDLRYPQWSKMGKFVRDIRSSMDAIDELEYLDNNQIYLLGNTIGGAVSIMAAALDDRVAGVATVAAFSPWRASDSQFESLRNYSHIHGFIPRIGYFVDEPTSVPVDFGEIIAAYAPKPMLLIAPELDRHTDIPALKEMMSSVNKVYSLYDREDNIRVIYQAGEINRMSRDMYETVGDFFLKISKSRDSLSRIGEAETNRGWEILFNGEKPASKWRSVKNAKFPSKGWKVVDGNLVITSGGKGGDIITREKYSDFELVFDYKLSDSANTGVKYLVNTLQDSNGRKVLNGPEFQLIDDYKHESVIDNKSPETSTGSLYLLYAPVGKQLNGPGEWNSVRIIVRGNRVEHWLNGKKIVDYNRGSSDFRKRVSETKFKEFKDYGEAESGHILLQDHKDQAYFRNIKIRRLES